MKDTCIVSFGRINPVHIGHGYVFDKAKSFQEQYNADLKIYLSTSTDINKNPLPPELKRYYVEGFYPDIQPNIGIEDNLFDVMQNLDGKYLDILFICGSDRVSQFQKTLDSYNGKLYNFCNINVVQAGLPREASLYSSTQMRSFALNNEFDKFSTFLPGNETELKLELFEDVIKYMRK